MRKIVFDIETCAFPFESLSESQQEYLLRYTDKEKDKNNTDRYSITPVDFEVRLNLPPLYEIFRTYKKEASKSRLWFKVFR